MKINKKYILSIINNWYWPVISFDVLFLILYEFENSREICKKIIVALFGQELSNNISNILKNPIRFWSIKISYTGIQIVRYLLFILFIIGMVKVAIRIAKKFWYWLNYRKSLEGNLEIQLDKYLKNNYDKCFLVTGEWGTGKTYKVNNFISKYKKCHNNHIYNISCFGLSSREELIKQIKKSCEKQDYNYKTRILDMINYIPILGSALYKLFKNDYELSDLKPDSIFVFDDFERIAPSMTLSRSSNYRTDLRIGSRGDNFYNEFNEVLSKIGDTIVDIDREQSISMEYKKMFRYDVVAGLIDELVEKYKMKVIVICSSSIGNYYLNELFTNKLGAIRYNVVGEKMSFKPIAEKDLNHCYSIDEFKRMKIQKFIDENHDDIDRVWKNNNCKNLRNLSSIFMNFISIIEQLNRDEVEKYYCYWRCIFYSILYIYINNGGRRRYTMNSSEDNIGESLCIDKNDSDSMYDLRYSIGEIFNNIENKTNIMWMGEEFYERYLRGEYIEKDFLIKVFNKLDEYENKTIENIIVTKGKVGIGKINNVIDFKYILLLLLECNDDVIIKFFENNSELEITFGDSIIEGKIKDIIQGKHSCESLDSISTIYNQSLNGEPKINIVSNKMVENEIVKNTLFRSINRALESKTNDKNENNIEGDNKPNSAQRLWEEYNSWIENNNSKDVVLKN